VIATVNSLTLAAKKITVNIFTVIIFEFEPIVEPSLLTVTKSTAADSSAAAAAVSLIGGFDIGISSEKIS
jgi:hypothetical protein